MPTPSPSCGPTNSASKPNASAEGPGRTRCLVRPRTGVHHRNRPVHPQSISEHFKDLSGQAGLPPIRLHDAATVMLAAGIDIKIVQEILGHSDRATTSDTYTSALPELAAAAIGQVADVINRHHQTPPRTHRSPGRSGTPTPESDEGALPERENAQVRG
ncbi:tyrosine-type recombinase/integrase [Actinomadura sp. 6N118]|uniref:tyrosine-type recombinase/integrase n=1 Tax=Actinomadura sp. 6N118 TaxID=3375151 RepID=UPI0037960859